jgi:hypothetical protein
MSSWPPTLADWGELTPRLRDGDPVCAVHGLVAAEQAPIGIPVCPHCRQSVLLAHRDREGVLRSFAEPSPARCAAAERHPLAAGHTLLGWTSCRCAGAAPGPGGHRTWLCRDCVELGRGHDTAELRWPPCALQGGSPRVGQAGQPSDGR